MGPALIEGSCRGLEYSFCRNGLFVGELAVEVEVGTDSVVEKPGSWTDHLQGIVDRKGTVVVEDIAAVAGIAVAKKLAAV